MKGVCRFGIKGKLAPRYISSYPIIDKYGPTSYQVELPSKLSGVHNVFHVSQLKRCLKPRPILSLKIPLHWNRIWHTRHIPPRFSTNKTEPSTIRLLGSTRFNGMIIPKMKPRGNMRTFYDPTIILKKNPHRNMRTFYDPTTPTSFHQGNQYQISPPLLLLQSRDKIPF
jgi:hypothetical protein